MNRAPHVRLALALLLVASAGCSRRADVAPPPPTAAPRSEQADRVAAAPPVRAVSAKRALPPDPAPPAADKAGEIPELVRRLNSDTYYRTLWKKAHESDTDLLMTAVSEMLTSQSGLNGEMSMDVAGPLKARHLTNSAILLWGILCRSQTLPTEIAASVNTYFSSISGEAHQGLYRETVQQKHTRSPPIDFTALAVVLHPNNASYLRELISARRSGPMGWAHVDHAFRPYLSSEKAAFERLAAMTELTPDEAARLAFLHLPQVGDSFRLGEFRYTISSAKALSGIGGPASVQADDGAVFVVIEYSIENLSNSTATVVSDDFALLDSQGRTFRPSSEAASALAMAGRKRDLALSELQPGVARKGVIAFEIPTSADDLRLVVPEKGLTGSKRVDVAISLPRE